MINMDYYDEVVEIKSKPKSVDTESVINTNMEIEEIPKKEVIYND